MSCETRIETGMKEQVIMRDTHKQADKTPGRCDEEKKAGQADKEVEKVVKE